MIDFVGLFDYREKHLSPLPFFLPFWLWIDITPFASNRLDLRPFLNPHSGLRNALAQCCPLTGGGTFAVLKIPQNSTKFRKICFFGNLKGIFHYKAWFWGTKMVNKVAKQIQVN
jgi:hypothetical protein